MKKFTIALLSIIFVTLITGSIQSISADDLEPGQEFSEDEKTEVVFLTKDSKYKLHVQVVVRNADNQVVSVAEAIGGMYIHHKMTDNAFDTSMGKKKIVTVDGIKYEKIQFQKSVKTSDYPSILPIMVSGLWQIQICGELVIGQIGFPCANIFNMRTNQLVLDEDDSITLSWTILRIMN